VLAQRIRRAANVPLESRPAVTKAGETFTAHVLGLD
jgi:hypothetical protein